MRRAQSTPVTIKYKITTRVQTNHTTLQREIIRSAESNNDNVTLFEIHVNPDNLKLYDGKLTPHSYILIKRETNLAIFQIYVPINNFLE